MIFQRDEIHIHGGGGGVVCHWYRLPLIFIIADEAHVAIKEIGVGGVFV